MVVVVGLLGTIAGLLVLGSAESRKQQRLDVAVETFISTVREVQTWGQTGRAYGAANDDNRFDYGYGVYVDNPQNNPTSFIVYGGAGTEATYDDCIYDPTREFAEYKLPKGIKVSATQTAGGAGDNNHKQVQVLFRRGDTQARLVDNVDSSDPFRDTIEITFTNGDTERTVHINKFGLIYAIS